MQFEIIEETFQCNSNKVRFKELKKIIQQTLLTLIDINLISTGRFYGRIEKV